MDEYLIVEILESFLGSYKQHYSHKGQISFNCPNCDNGYNKGNLEVNYKRDIFSCWACRELPDGVKGRGLRWLIWRFGSKDLFKEYCNLNPSFDSDYKREIIDVFLPKEFNNFDRSNEKIKGYHQALDYLLKDRGLSMDIIQKFNLGFCNSGKYGGRIIVPSYDSNYHVNYFIARDYTGNSEIKYLNHENPKSDIVFNEYFINWDASVFLVEGVFDHIVLWNSIPLLGKNVSDLLLKRLQNKLKGNLYILLDPDAKENAKKIYEYLSFGNLKNNIYTVDLPENDDVSDVYKKCSVKSFYKLISMGVTPENKVSF